MANQRLIAQLPIDTRCKLERITQHGQTSGVIDTNPNIQTKPPLEKLSVKIGFHLNGFHPLPTVPFLLWLVQLYMIFVAIALLGRFYQRHQDRLDWAV